MHFHAPRPLLAALAVVFAASLLLYTVVWIVTMQPGAQPDVELGFENDYQAADHTEVVRIVYKDSPAERAGMRVGDRILAINDVPIPDEDYEGRVWMRHKVGDQIRLTVTRAGSNSPFVLTGTFRHVTSSSGDALGEQLTLWFPWPFVLVGLAVLFLRLEDVNAWLLAFLFGGVVVSRGLPSLTPTPAWWPIAMAYQALFVGLVGPVFYCFYARFPARSFDRRWPWLKWTTLGFGLLFAWGGIHTGNSKLPPPFSRWLSDADSGRVAIVFVMACIILGLLSFAANFVQTRDPEARRKIRMMFWSTVVSLGPNLVRLAVTNFSDYRVPRLLDNLLESLLVLMPLAFAYAVLVHRVLEIPVLLKRSARYLLVQRGFTVLLSMFSIGLALLFALSVSRYLQPVVKTSQPSSIAMGAMLGTALVWGGTQVHRRVSDRIDRAFFRSSYDARVILQDLAEEIRTTIDRTELARLLAVQLAEALGPSFVRVQLQPGERPAGAAEESPPEYIVPILGRDGSRLGELQLGPLRSEEPYSGEDRQLLAAVASQAATALENMRLAEEIAERIEGDRRTAREMEIARDVQSRLLPQAPPRLKTLDCAACCLQARAVGGDYYDFLDLGPDCTGFVLADVSGKGVYAALLVAHLQAFLRTQGALLPREPLATLQQVNRMLCRSTATQNFATMFFGIYDDSTRELLYVNCGHNAPVLLRRGGSVERLGATATVIGAFDGWQGTECRTRLAPGDLLVVFSDGVTEASRGEEEFGETRLLDALRAAGTGSAEAVVSGVLSRVQEFSGEQQSDDLTLLVARALPA